LPQHRCRRTRFGWDVDDGLVDGFDVQLDGLWTNCATVWCWKKRADSIARSGQSSCSTKAARRVDQLVLLAHSRAPSAMT